MAIIYKEMCIRDSINNCKNIYHQNNVIIVSQGFHNLRALFYARNNDINALGFDAQDVLSLSLIHI